MFTGAAGGGVDSAPWFRCGGGGVRSFGPLCLGDSVAVDGVCLTVADCVGDGFRADVSEETLGRTTLGRKAERGVR